MYIGQYHVAYIGHVGESHWYRTGHVYRTTLRYEKVGKIEIFFPDVMIAL